MSAHDPDRGGNPYPGLRPFSEEEEFLFFGRESQVDALVDKLGATRFLAVVGTSGSGKSSLVNCGLRPALRRGLMARAGTAWRIAQFRPGAHPIRSMAGALARELFNQPESGGISLAEIVETTLQMSKLGVVDIWEQARLPADVNLLLVVDQFEELFRYRQLAAAQGQQSSAALQEATAFVNLLLETREQTPRSNIHVVLTMRSDFLGDCAQFAGLPEAINAGQYLVPRMTRDERRAAITGPASVYGTEISPVLLTRLVNDVGDNPDQLSILQHALNRTWARRQNEGGATGPLDLGHYEGIGTMAHALDRHAEKAYAELQDDRQRELCERVFRAITDKATDPRGVRRPATVEFLCELTEASVEELERVTDAFRKPSRSFLMPPASEKLAPETVVDISHESLMRVWQRLQQWADAEAASVRQYRRLAETASEYRRGGAALWRAPDLDVALGWRASQRPNRAWGQRYHPDYDEAMAFLEASELEARTAARQRERSVRIRRTIAFLGLVLLVTGLVNGMLYAQYTAEDDTREQQGTLETQLRDEQAQAVQKDSEVRKFWQQAARGDAAPSGPWFELYGALRKDALQDAQQIYAALPATEDVLGGRSPEQTAWENWGNVKRAQQRERKLIATLYKVHVGAGPSTAAADALRQWSTYESKLDESLFVEPIDFRIAQKLQSAAGSGDTPMAQTAADVLSPDEDRLAGLYYALETGNWKVATERRAQIVTSRDNPGPDPVVMPEGDGAGAPPEPGEVADAAESAWRFVHRVRDRMFLSYLSRLGRAQADAPDKEPAFEIVDRVGVYGKGSGGMPTARAIAASLRRIYLDAQSRPAAAEFADPVHYSIACRLIAGLPSAGAMKCDYKASEDGMSERYADDLMSVYDSIEKRDTSAAADVVRTWASTGDTARVEYLLAASALDDPQVAVRPSLTSMVAGWIGKLKYLIVGVLLWPAWEGFRWLQRRLGVKVAIKYRANPVRRFLAYLTDLCIACALGLVLGALIGGACWIVAGLASGSYVDHGQMVGTVLGIVVFLAAATAYMLLRDSIEYRFARSPGKVLFSLRPVLIAWQNPGKVTKRVSLRRNLLLVLPIWIVPPLYILMAWVPVVFVPVLLLLFALPPIELILSAIRDGRTLHDRLGKTRVIDIRSEEAKALGA